MKNPAIHLQVPLTEGGVGWPKAAEISGLTIRRTWVVCPLMSFNEVLAELPGLTVAERQMLIRCALDLDDGSLSREEEMLVEERLAEHRKNPATAISLAEMKVRVRSLFGS